MPRLIYPLTHHRDDTKPPHVTQVYGANPQDYAKFGLPGHDGIDYAAHHRQPIYAAADGIVKMVKSTMNDGWHNYGIHVRISHADGFETIYAHFDEAIVSVGQVVTMGQKIGYADNTGNSKGTHLHFGLKINGVLSDPQPHIDPILPGQADTLPVPPQDSKGTALTLVDNLNIRRSPSTSGQVVTKVGKNVKIEITGMLQEADGYVWLQIASPQKINNTEVGGCYFALRETGKQFAVLKTPLVS